MKQVTTLCITLLSIVLLTGCDFLTRFLESPTYTITFNSNGGEKMNDIQVHDFIVHDFNTSNIPIYTRYNFLGWFINEATSEAYVENFDYSKDLILYAKWQILSYEVSIKDTHKLETTIYNVDHDLSLENVLFNYEGLDFIGLKYQVDDKDFDYETPITKDLSLYTVFDVKEGYHIITFETNTDFDIPNQTAKDQTKMIKPADPVDLVHIFYGWYIDPNFNTVYDFNSLVITDITLYAKFVESTVHNYELDESILKWTLHPNAIHYTLHIMEIDNTLGLAFDTVDDAFIDLKVHESLLKESTNIHVFAVFESGVTYKIFDVTLKFEYTSTMYEENFESEWFPARTNYSNDVNPRIDGPIDNQYKILNGSASKTNAIAGLRSIQLRNNTNRPYLQTEFYLSKISQITFLARSYNHDITLKLINELGIVEESYEIELTSQVLTHSVDVINNTGYRIQFELLPITEVTTGEQVFIDDIKVYSTDTPTKLVEVHATVEPDIDLANIIARFATQRGNLTPPGFNALSSAGVLEYYATLNGLTKDAFKTELSNILKTTHKRTISYDEARFVLEQSDIVANGNNPYLDGIYSNHEIIPYWDGGATWAREHVWPNSRLGIPRVSSSSKNQGSDVHNLRAINPSVNSSRSNRYFLEGDSFGLVGKLGYYPGDAYKGDVARILFYMLARYPEILSLSDDNIIDNAYSLEGTVMGVLSLLIKWHQEDPVSQFEINRNEVIYTYQGNRNPFIDNPDYVHVYFN